MGLALHVSSQRVVYSTSLHLQIRLAVWLRIMGNPALHLIGLYNKDLVSIWLGASQCLFFHIYLQHFVQYVILLDFKLFVQFKSEFGWSISDDRIEVGANIYRPQLLILLPSSIRIKFNFLPKIFHTLIQLFTLYLFQLLLLQNQLVNFINEFGSFLLFDRNWICKHLFSIVFLFFD